LAINYNLKKILLVFLLAIICILVVAVPAGCRKYDSELDISYFFKTEPEKAVIDFVCAMDSHDADYIYSNFLPDSDRRNISKEKFIREMTEILSDIENIDVESIVYLGYESNMSKVVLELSVLYKNGDQGVYKKYIYLIEENGKWKIVFDKTFI